MESDAVALIQEGLALDVDQRAVVANALFDSLVEAEQAHDVDAAWRAEAARRLHEVRIDGVGLLDADAHYARLRASLAE